MNANEIIEEVSKHPSIDELMARYHEHPTREQRLEIVRLEREARAAWKAKKEKRAEEREQEENENDEV